MKELIDWLIGIEERADKLYAACAVLFSGDAELAALLEKLSLDEKVHKKLLESFPIQGIEDPELLVELDDDTRGRVEDAFLRSEELLENGELTKSALLAIIVEVEHSEWNDLFTYAVNRLNGTVGSMFQTHKGRVRSFLEKDPGNEELVKRIKELPDTWKENILVVDDEDIIRDVLTDILVTEGSVSVASNGAEALALLEKNYYAAVITDLRMPVMDGIEFYNEAVKKYPHLKERVLFFSASLSPELNAFLEENNLMCIKKPSPIRDIKEAVQNILYR